jgi:hypothetical protein
VRQGRPTIVSQRTQLRVDRRSVRPNLIAVISMGDAGHVRAIADQIEAAAGMNCPVNVRPLARAPPGYDGVSENGRRVPSFAIHKKISAARRHHRESIAPLAGCGIIGESGVSGQERSGKVCDASAAAGIPAIENRSAAIGRVATNRGIDQPCLRYVRVPDSVDGTS